VVHPSRFGGIFAVVALGFVSMCVTAQAQTFSIKAKNVLSNSDFQVTPQVGVDPAGNINVVWEDDTTSNSYIFFARSTDGGASFATTQNLSSTLGSSWNPRIAVDNAGNINVVWIDNTSGNQDIFFSRSTDGGINFNGPINLSKGAATSSNPQIAVDSKGGVNVVWENDDHTLGVMFVHSSDGSSFPAAASNLATNTTGSVSPAIAAGTDGSVNVAWEDDFSSRAHISFRRSTDNGQTFPTLPMAVSNSVGNATGAQVAVDGSGNVNVVWVDDGPGNFVIMYNRLNNGSTSFSGATPLSGAGNAANPQVLVDAAGNALVVWQGNTGTVLNNDVFFARSVAGTFSATNVSANTGDSSNPFLNVDALGNVNLAWTDTTPGKANAFFAQSVNGGAFTSQNLSIGAGPASGVQIGSDKNGNLDVVWSDNTSNPSQILFSRFSVPQAANQPPVANAGADQTVQCAGPNGTAVMLNGTLSSDPQGQTLSFLWTDDANNSVVGKAAIVPLTLGMGSHAYTLTVTNTSGLSAQAKTKVAVVDTASPTLTVSLSPNYLQPPNHKLVQVTATVKVSDACDAKPTVQLVSITSTDPIDADDVQAVGGGPVPFGTDVRSFRLAAELNHNGSDRVYTVTYQATDASGNTTVASAQVGVGKGGTYGPAKPPSTGKGKHKRKDKDDDRDRKSDHDHD
jgi:K319L-like, PKD domain